MRFGAAKLYRMYSALFQAAKQMVPPRGVELIVHGPQANTFRYLDDPDYAVGPRSGKRAWPGFLLSFQGLSVTSGSSPQVRLSPKVANAF